MGEPGTGRVATGSGLVPEATGGEARLRLAAPHAYLDQQLREEPVDPHEHVETVRPEESRR